MTTFMKFDVVGRSELSNGLPEAESVSCLDNCQSISNLHFHHDNNELINYKCFFKDDAYNLFFVNNNWYIFLRLHQVSTITPRFFGVTSGMCSS